MVCRIALPSHDENIPNAYMRNICSCHNTLWPNKANIQCIPTACRKLKLRGKCRIPPAHSRTLPITAIPADLQCVLLLKESRCDLPGNGDISLATLITLDNLIIQWRRDFELCLWIKFECRFTCHIDFLLRQCISRTPAAHKGIWLSCGPVGMLERQQVTELVRQRSTKGALEKCSIFNEFAPNSSLSTLARLVRPLPNKGNLTLWNRKSLKR